MPQFEIFMVIPDKCQETFHIGKFFIFLLNGVLGYRLSTTTLLRANCLTPTQLLVRSEFYLYNYHSAMVISQDI